MTNIGPPTVDPNPSIHNVPAVDSRRGAPVPPGLITAWGNFFLDSFIAQVAIGLGNVSILGVKPLAFLTAWGTNLEATASQAYAAAAAAQTTAQAATTVQGQQSTAKPGYLAGDATADAVFPISIISGATPATVPVSNADSVIGFITTPDNGLKSSVFWLGETTTSLTGFYINVYQMNTVTGLLTLLEASINIVSSVSNVLAWNYYDLATPVTSAVGNVYAIEMVVVGSGTYAIAGIPNDWKPANTTVFPQQAAATRDVTGGITAPSTFTPTYSGNVPWFGIGGFAFAGPTSIEYSTAGPVTYTIPNWLKWGDQIDVVMLGGGGGGQSSVSFLTGQGGGAGSWTTRTLVYGVDIPTGTTTLAVTVGAGGTGGSGDGGHGTNGGDSTVAVAGLTTITASGGNGGIGGPLSHGVSPGNQTFDTITYTGGTQVNASANGHAPGGGGGGGAPYLGGGNGATGAVWLVAYQAGTTP